MTLSVVLVHSPSVGPTTWLPCSRRLRALGVDTVVPDLRHIGGGGPPYWPRVADTVAESMGQLDESGSVALVAHSNAGMFLPTIISASSRPVASVVLVDAGMPLGPGPVPVASGDFLPWLRSLAGPDGRLPRWTDWWSAADVAAMLPDPQVRAEVVADQPRLPVDYYEQTVPVPAPWPAVPGAYLQFTPGYDEDAARAQAAGWLYQRIAGDHLHEVVDPAAVTTAIHSLLMHTSPA